MYDNLGLIGEKLFRFASSGRLMISSVQISTISCSSFILAQTFLATGR
jgi:hypothetical protein